jgi:hypothetical protein
LNHRLNHHRCATDNAIAALGKIVAHHADSIDNAAVPAAWLGALPLKGDAVEAQSQHELLVKLVSAQDARILGEGNAHLPKILSVFVQVGRCPRRLLAAAGGCCRCVWKGCACGSVDMCHGAGAQPPADSRPPPHPTPPHTAHPPPQVLGRGTELVSEEVGRQMVALLQQLQASVPQQLLASSVGELTEKQQANFQAFMSGSVPGKA